jgi:DNA primase
MSALGPVTGRPAAQAVDLIRDPAAFLHDLLGRVDIVDVVGRHVQLKKAGINHKGLCPFHGEKTPSFIVSPTRQTYHCFGCGVHGNAVGFLMEHAGMGFLDAVNDLAQQVGMVVPEDDRSPQERERAAQAREHQVTLTEVLAKVGDHWRKELKKSPRAIDYLKGRGLTGEIAARFGLGYAPEGWRGLASVFARYDDPLLEEAGLVIAQDGESEGERKRYDRFRDRVMFPIRSVQGEVIGFGGRVLDRGEPKYLNSPETPVFVKGRELYGLFEARTALRQKGYVLVVEGYMDVVALAQLGFPNAVATLGTACTAEHVQKLFRFTDSVVFSFDGDAAGRRAAGRALEAALPHATDVRTIRFSSCRRSTIPIRTSASTAPRPSSSTSPRGAAVAPAAGCRGEGCELDTVEAARACWPTRSRCGRRLPDGGLKRQLPGELATRGAWSAATCVAVGRRHARPRRGAAHRRGAPCVAAAASTPGIANLLDRALWLLVQRSDCGRRWTPAHDLLAAQAAPYDAVSAAWSAASTSTARWAATPCSRLAARPRSCERFRDRPAWRRSTTRTARRPGAELATVLDGCG